MHLWSIKATANDLAGNEISERTGMYYFLASTLLVLFSTYYSLWWGVVRDWLFYFELFVLSVIAIVGCIKAFDSNGGNDGTAFVLRAICLSVPAGVRVNVFAVLFGLILYISAENLFSIAAFSDPLRAYTILSYAGFIGFSIYFWGLLVHGIKETRQHEDKKT